MNINDLKGAAINRLYRDPDNISSEKTIFETAKVVLLSKLEKGFIDQDAFDKAAEQLNKLEEETFEKGWRVHPDKPNHLYVKRTGSPGNYQYVYNDEKYQRYTDSKAPKIQKSSWDQHVTTVRNKLKEKFPKVEFSVSKSGHNEINVFIMKSPYKWAKGEDSINHYHLGNHSNQAFLKEVYDIASQSEHAKQSFHETGDYGTQPSFYVNMRVGKWDKPHQFTGADEGETEHKDAAHLSISQKKGMNVMQRKDGSHVVAPDDEREDEEKMGSKKVARYAGGKKDDDSGSIDFGKMKPKEEEKKTGNVSSTGGGVKLNYELKKAYELLGIDDPALFEKSHLEGEGSRGGHIVGHTKSGKPIYGNIGDHKKHSRGYTVEDHKDAASYHKKEKSKYEENREKTVHHKTNTDFHEIEADKKSKAIGHTKSGKIVYDSFEHRAHRDFTADDHIDAMMLHPNHGHSGEGAKHYTAYGKKKGIDADRLSDLADA